MAIDLKTLTIEKAQKALKAGEYTSVDLVSAYIDEIKKVNPEIHAYLEVYTDVLEQAKEADARRVKGEDRALLGIPFSIKDNILVKGKIASASSKILENYVASYDATVIKKLKEAGAIFIGRVNMDEFAMGGSTENSAFGVTKNPHDPKRVSGGSSGGSAASIAMHGALASLGSDTGGSIRQPASYCGVVGLKPTYGSVSRHGLMAMGSSLDVIGPIANTVSDCEIIFNAIKNDTSDSANGISGDRYDSTSIGTDEYQKIADTHVKKVDAPLRIGITPSLIHSGGVSLDVIKNYEQSVEKLKKAGCEIVEVDNDLSNIKYSLPVYYVLIFAEVSSNMARFDGVKYGSKVEGKDLLEDYLFTRGNLLGKEVRRRIMLGTYVLSSGYYDAYYNKANIVRDLIRTDFKKAFESVDVILTPTAPTPAFEIGAHASDPLQMYLEDIFTVTANLVGVPAISIPSGMIKLGDNQLPLGIQFTAPHCREDLLFEVGKLFESIRE